MVNKVVILMNIPVMITPVNGRINTPVTINKTQISRLLVITEVRIACFLNTVLEHK